MVDKIFFYLEFQFLFLVRVLNKFKIRVVLAFGDSGCGREAVEVYGSGSLFMSVSPRVLPSGRFTPFPRPRRHNSLPLDHVQVVQSTVKKKEDRMFHDSWGIKTDVERSRVIDRTNRQRIAKAKHKKGL